MSVGVILVAAGRGRRFNAAGVPKQFRPLQGRPLYQWSLGVFERTPEVTSVVVVVPVDRRLSVAKEIARAKFRKVSAVVPGGAERADSVRAGLRALPPCKVVLIHDAARALVTSEVVVRVARAARRTGAALAAWPVPDTVKEASGKSGARALVRRTVPRAGLWLAQTPQGFRREESRRFFEISGALTDDVQVFERANRPVEIVLGSAQNFKVTLPEDFALCERLVAPTPRGRKK